MRDHDQDEQVSETVLPDMTHRTVPQQLILSCSDMVAFLGDADFPHVIMRVEQAEKILRYRDPYKRYSRLGLSNDYDHPMAIDGLQHRGPRRGQDRRRVRCLRRRE